MKLSDCLINILISNKITHIFELSGGAITHILDSLYGRKDITAVSMHHEMAAAIAAEGYARAGEKIGAALATSGPGATNLITGIGSCYFDSIPCLFITGQVNTYEYKDKRPIRQMGFQETDIVDVVKPLTKKSLMITENDDFLQLLDDCISMTVSDRCGPVLIDIPMNIQRSDIEYTAPIIHQKPKDDSFSEYEIPCEIFNLIQKAKRPIIIAGGGIRSGRAIIEFLKFVNKTHIPVVTSLMGLDSISHEHPLFVGMLGTYGNRYANLAVANADLLIILGSRLDTRQTGTIPESFAREAKKIHVDIDKNELCCKVKVDYPINQDLKVFLRAFNNTTFSMDNQMFNEWNKCIINYREKYPQFPIEHEVSDPNYLMQVISKHAPDDSIYCVDVGQIQMWAAQNIIIKEKQRFLTQGGMASIGSALPLAIGAAFACPFKTVICIVGDGGFHLNIQELQTVYHYNLPIKIILFNNNGYGMIKQFQKQYFNERYQSTGIGFSNPDFVQVVSAYKLKALRCEDTTSLLDSINNLFSDNCPSFLEISIPPSSVVTPKLAVNMPIEEQDPLINDMDFLKDMIVKPYDKSK